MFDINCTFQSNIQTIFFIGSLTVAFVDIKVYWKNVSSIKCYNEYWTSLESEKKQVNTVPFEQNIPFFY